MQNEGRHRVADSRISGHDQTCGASWGAWTSVRLFVRRLHLERRSSPSIAANGGFTLFGLGLFSLLLFFWPPQSRSIELATAIPGEGGVLPLGARKSLEIFMDSFPDGATGQHMDLLPPIMRTSWASPFVAFGRAMKPRRQPDVLPWARRLSLLGRPVI